MFALVISRENVNCPLEITVVLVVLFLENLKANHAFPRISDDNNCLIVRHQNPGRCCTRPGAFEVGLLGGRSNCMLLSVDYISLFGYL